MKRTLLFAFTMFCAGVSAQENFSGINTSRRVGILNAAINPAEFANLKNDHEINVFNFSLGVANNKITFGELVGGEDLEDDIFSGSDAVNFRVDLDIMGPAFAMKRGKWGFGISSAAKLRANLVDIDVNLGDALSESAIDGLITGTSNINTGYNQRATATSWGEIGLSAARELYNTEEHRFTGGATFKLLFPGSYANMSADRFTGRIERVGGDVTLYDASANVNIAYSGSLADDYSDSSGFTEFFAGGLNGFAVDLGVSYQWKDPEDSRDLLNAGLSVRNLGSMTFKDNDNVSTTYRLTVDNPSGLNLNQFEDADGFEDIEDILEENPEHFTRVDNSGEFKVKLPAVFSAYADVRVYNKWFVTMYTQQKLNEDNTDKQIAVQNILSVTPRYSGNFFEAYAPLAHNEISGFTAGLGVRLGGFFIGSNSLITAVVSDVNQADAYLGFRIGF